ncbi:Uncharacterised protein [Vibrio cholerae]|nr:Uncharacterised protein [Vibrio cholerae]
MVGALPSRCLNAVAFRVSNSLFGSTLKRSAKRWISFGFSILDSDNQSGSLPLTGKYSRLG